MAAPSQGDMKKCDPKCRCAYGPYVGRAYPCDDPCAGQGEECTFSCDQGCNCDTTTLYGMFITASSGNLEYDSVNLPTILLPVNLNPYFDEEGNTILEQVFFSGVSAAWDTTCEGGVLSCPGNYEGVLNGVKTGICSGGGLGWMNYGYVYYKNGAYDRFQTRGSILATAGTQCGAPVGTSVSLTVQVLPYTP